MFLRSKPVFLSFLSIYLYHCPDLLKLSIRCPSLQASKRFEVTRFLIWCYFSGWLIVLCCALLENSVDGYRTLFFSFSWIARSPYKNALFACVYWYLWKFWRTSSHWLDWPPSKTPISMSCSNSSFMFFHFPLSWSDPALINDLNSMFCRTPLCSIVSFSKFIHHVYFVLDLHLLAISKNMLVKEKNMNNLFQSFQILFCFFMKKENNNLPLEKYQDFYFVLFFFFKKFNSKCFLFYLVIPGHVSRCQRKVWTWYSCFWNINNFSHTKWGVKQRYGWSLRSYTKKMKIK